MKITFGTRERNSGLFQHYLAAISFPILFLRLASVGNALVPYTLDISVCSYKVDSTGRCVCSIVNVVPSCSGGPSPSAPYGAQYSNGIPYAYAIDYHPQTSGVTYTISCSGMHDFSTGAGSRDFRMDIGGYGDWSLVTGPNNCSSNPPSNPPPAQTGIPVLLQTCAKGITSPSQVQISCLMNGQQNVNSMTTWPGDIQSYPASGPGDVACVGIKTIGLNAPSDASFICSATLTNGFSRTLTRSVAQGLPFNAGKTVLFPFDLRAVTPFQITLKNKTSNNPIPNKTVTWGYNAAAGLSVDNKSVITDSNGNAVFNITQASFHQSPVNIVFNYPDALAIQGIGVAQFPLTFDSKQQSGIILANDNSAQITLSVQTVDSVTKSPYAPPTPLPISCLLSDPATDSLPSSLGAPPKNRWQGGPSPTNSQGMVTYPPLNYTIGTSGSYFSCSATLNSTTYSAKQSVPTITPGKNNPVSMNLPVPTSAASGNASITVRLMDSTSNCNTTGVKVTCSANPEVPSGITVPPGPYCSPTSATTDNSGQTTFKINYPAGVRTQDVTVSVPSPTFLTFSQNPITKPVPQTAPPLFDFNVTGEKSNIRSISVYLSPSMPGANIDCKGDNAYALRCNPTSTAFPGASAAVFDLILADPGKSGTFHLSVLTKIGDNYYHGDLTQSESGGPQYLGFRSALVMPICCQAFPSIGGTPCPSSFKPCP